MVLTVVSGVTIGIVAAVRRGTRYDYAGTLLAVLGQSLPSFWLGIMLVLLFGVTLRWLPTSGYQNWTYLILPSITLAAYPTALVARLTRSSMLEILSRDYIRTGRAKGLAERAVVLRHALRNATIPVLTVIGLQIGDAPRRRGHHGVGVRVAGDGEARRRRDLLPGLSRRADRPDHLRHDLRGLINLLVDALYTVVDPRIRYR